MINIQFVQIAPSKALSEFISWRLKRISQKYVWIIKTDVFIKYEKDSKKKGKICEIQISAPGGPIYASANEFTYEKAVLNALENLQILLKKRKHIFTRIS